jgi:hypothetical protein
VRSDHTLGGPVHLGAAWIHGHEGHPLTPLVTHTVATSWDDVRTYVAGTGALAAAHDVRLGERFDDLLRTVEASPADVDAASIALPLVADAAGDDPVALAVLATWLRGEYENLYAAPLDDVSAGNGAEPYALPGDNLMVLDDLSVIVDRLADGLDVRTGNAVAVVAERSVTLVDGTSLAADAVIVTVPIGVLQRKAIVFEPAIPTDVLDALAHIGAGPVAKGFFTYDEAWWAPERSWFAVAPPDAPSSDPWAFEIWIDVSELTGRPTLCAFAVGDRAPEIEAMNEHDRCRLADAILASVHLR